LRAVFADEGWTVEDFRNDYGEDLLVHIFTDRKATEYFFYVQVRATDHIDRFLRKQRAYIAHPIKTSQLEYWLRFGEPVLLIIWDAKKERFYWECIQTAIDESSIDESSMSGQKTVSIEVPTRNTLDKEGMRRIVARTKRRLKRFAREKEGAEYLLDFLRRKLKMEIIYEPQNGLLVMPDGRFIPRKNGDPWVLLFGKLGDRAAAVESEFGVSRKEMSEILLKIHLKRLEHVQKVLRRDGRLVLRDKLGTVRTCTAIDEYLDEYRKAIERHRELYEADS
jgi:Domain of unknown function (DUF4365)